MEEFKAGSKSPLELVGHTNFQAALLTLFRKILEKFDFSNERFNIILSGFYQGIDKELPPRLKAELNDHVVMLINDYFGGCGCYPKISPFKRIPKEDLLILCRTYFKEDDGFRDEAIVFLIYCFYVKPFEYIKINNKSLENSEIIRQIPQNLRSGIIKDYIENYWFPIEVSSEKKQDMERNGLLPLEKGQKVIPNFLLTRFLDLSRVDKKILLDLVWSAYTIAPFDKRRFTDKKFSVDDKEMLIDLAVNDYLELYNHFYKNTKKD
jgi:hypothetical protein